MIEIARPKIKNATHYSINEYIENEITLSDYLFEKENININKITGLEFDTCIFDKIKAEKTTFFNVHFTDIIFKNSDFLSCRFEMCSFIRCSFENCNMTGVSIIDSYFDNVTISSNMKYANIVNNKLKKTIFNESILIDARFLENNFTKVYYNKCDMRNFEFSKCNLKDINLSTCNIENIKLNPNEVRGLTIDIMQAIYITQLLGIKIER